METLTVGQLARRGDVHLETLRYYERRGLMPPPLRKASGHRVYAASAIRRLRFIKRAQKLGFSLAEIKELLALRSDPRRFCNDVVRQINTKAQEVERKLAQLEAIKRALLQLRDSCDGNCQVSECGILESLDSENL